MDDSMFNDLPPYNPVFTTNIPPSINSDSNPINVELNSDKMEEYSPSFTNIKKTNNHAQSIFSGNGFKAFVALLGTSAVVLGSLVAKGVVVLGSAAAGLLAAKILIPIGCVILVVLVAKMVFDAVKHCLHIASLAEKKYDYESSFGNANIL